MADHKVELGSDLELEKFSPGKFGGVWSKCPYSLSTLIGTQRTVCYRKVGLKSSTMRFWPETAVQNFGSYEPVSDEDEDEDEVEIVDVKPKVKRARLS